MNWFELAAYSITSLCVVGIICLPFALVVVIRQMIREYGESEND